MAAGRQFRQSQLAETDDEAAEDGGRISGSRPAQREFEPLPLGSEAFLPPLPPAVYEESPRGAAILPWIMLGSSLLAASAAFAIAMTAKAPDAQLEQRGPRPSVESRVAQPAAQVEAVPPIPPAVEDEPASAERPSPAPIDGAPPQVGGETHTHATHHHHHQAALPQHLERAQVIAALAQVRPAVLACFGATSGTAEVKVTVVGNSGRVTTAQVRGQGGPIGSCIAREVRRARFPQFADASLVISYPFVR